MNDYLFNKQQNIFTSECDEEIQKQVTLAIDFI